jgi:hypothetical protein
LWEEIRGFFLVQETSLDPSLAPRLPKWRDRRTIPGETGYRMLLDAIQFGREQWTTGVNQRECVGYRVKG